MREQAVAKTGYEPEAIGLLLHTLDQPNNSRQKAYVFETANDVRKHPGYAHSKLSDICDLAAVGAEDGPVLVFGPEVTVGG